MKRKNFELSSSTSSPKRARTDLTLDIEREIIVYNNSVNESKRIIADHFSQKFGVRISRTTIHDIIANSEKLFEIEKIRGIGAKLCKMVRIFRKRLRNIKKSKDRKVLLLTDNAGGHGTEFEYSHLEVKLIKPNCISHLQPIDAGIIRNFK